MSRVLLVDTNVSSAPIHDWLVCAGHEVFVCGGNPDDFLARISPNYLATNYSDLAAMRELLEKHGFDYLVPGCNDRSYSVCAALNKDGRFPGLDAQDVAETINHKQLFREFARRTDLPVPKLVAADATPEAWPLIVKPVDAFSGRGVTVLLEAEKAGLTAAIKLAEGYSSTRSCVVEEYVEGQLYSHSAFISSGNVQVDFIVEEHGSANPFVVDTSRVVANFPLLLLERLRECVGAMAEQLGLVDGLVHTQFIRNGDALWLIEVTRRCPGDLYSQLIESATDYRYVEAYVRPFLGLAGIPSLSDSEPVRMMRHTVSLPAENTLGSLRFSMPLQIERLVPMSRAGDSIKASPFGRIALLFARAASDEEFSELFTATLERRLYHIDSRY